VDRGLPIPHRQRDLQKHIPNRRQLTRLPNPRLIGAEPEINNIKQLGKSRALQEAIDKWGDLVVEDGSIGVQPTAFEINTQPSGGDLFLDHMKDLCDGLAKMDAQPSQKCGIHIHIDCSDYTMYDLRRLIEIYVKTERALFDLCHPYRLNYQYSKVCGKFLMKKGLPINPREFRQALNETLYEEPTKLLTNENYLAAYHGVRKGSTNYRNHIHLYRQSSAATLANAKKAKGNPHRYNAFNVHSFFIRKTIEFRHHEGTSNYEDIVGWAQVLQELVSDALRMTNAQVQALPRNSKKALLALMPERLHTYIYKAWAENKRLRDVSPEFQQAYAHWWGPNTQ
jgi:hypothetical protein